jgi:hypothetical protein
VADERVAKVVPMGKSELEAAISTLETLIQVSALLLAIGIMGVVGFGVRHWSLSKRLQALRHAEDEERQVEIARLNKETDDARQSAARAIQTAQKAEEDLASANARAAKAYEQAAQAEKEAAKFNELAASETLARVQLEDEIASCSITAEQEQFIAARMRPLGGQRIDFLVYPNNVKGCNSTERVAQALRDSGWSVVVFQALDERRTGIRVEVDSRDEAAIQRAERLTIALRKCGLPVGGPTLTLPSSPKALPAYIGPQPMKIEASIRLTIGPR